MKTNNISFGMSTGKALKKAGQEGKKLTAELKQRVDIELRDFIAENMHNPNMEVARLTSSKTNKLCFAITGLSGLFTVANTAVAITLNNAKAEFGIFAGFFAASTGICAMVEKALRSETKKLSNQFMHRLKAENFSEEAVVYGVKEVLKRGPLSSLIFDCKTSKIKASAEKIIPLKK